MRNDGMSERRRRAKIQDIERLFSCILLLTMTILCGILVAQRSGLPAHRSRRYLAFVAGFTTAHPSHALQQPPLNVPQRKTPPYESKSIDQVEITVKNVLDKYNASDDILKLPPAERQAVGVARNLHKRLTALSRNNDCRRCWLQRKHCICSQCPPLEGSIPKIRRLFLLIHHKEVCLAVDTARMILASFPDTCRLVVGGIGPEFQESMAEMLDAIQNERNCLVLFPADNAKTFCELEASHLEQDNSIDVQSSTSDERWDVIVIDGTWSQARKLHARYIPLEAGGGPPRVQLSDEAVALLAMSAASNQEASGHQLRRHPIIWKAVSTLEATRLLLGNMANSPLESHPWDALSTYQQIADSATRVQLGPHR